MGSYVAPLGWGRATMTDGGTDGNWSFGLGPAPHPPRATSTRDQRRSRGAHMGDRLVASRMPDGTIARRRQTIVAQAGEGRAWGRET